MLLTIRGYATTWTVCLDGADPTKVHIRNLTGITIHKAEGFRPTDVYYAIYDVDPANPGPIPAFPNQPGQPVAVKALVTNGVWVQAQDTIFDNPCALEEPVPFQRWIIIYHHFRAEGNPFEFYLPELVTVLTPCQIENPC